MNNEIKEIIEKMFLNCDTQEEKNKVLDYITNLQEENERLKEELKNRPMLDFTFDVYKELEDYKSRCEKAIEYIKNNCYYLVDNDDKKLLNILGGGDE